MGYTYCVRISIEYDGDIYKNTELIQEIESVYQDISASDHKGWFPVFGEVDISLSGGHGSGMKEECKMELIRFSSKFPMYKFYIYFFSWDMMNLQVYEMQDRSIEEIASYDVESGKKIPGGTASIAFTGDLYIKNEILA